MKKLFPIIILLLSVIACDNDRGFPIDDTLLDFIKKEYRGATVRDAEYSDNGLFEVEIRHDSRVKDVYFDSDNNWVYTTWDVNVLSLPAAVKNAVEQSYPGYRIDDADYVQRPEGDLYKLEIESGELEKTVYALPNGGLQ
jgi:hypothetical protein